MESKLYCFALVFLTITTACTDALDCYTCTNATYVSECKSTTTCNAGEICFSDHIQTPHRMLYSFGCRAEAKCSSIIQDGNSAGSGSIVSRSTSTGTCSECCKNQHCNRQLCQHSSDGSWSTWLTWSPCDVTCGNGTQARIRKCTEPSPSGGGHDCAGMSQEAQTCTEEPCPVHGAWAAWNTWGSCSATCGIGLQRRDRSCSTPYPGPNGNHCFGDSRDDQICLANTYHDGDWSSWQAWGTCSRTCGDGIRSRSRSCDNPLPSIQGKYCQGEPYQVETCNMQSCPVTNGGWGSWTSWTSCTASCNGGMQSRQRICNNPKPSADGDFCDGNAMNVRMCNQQHCPITNGGWGSWTSWTSCSVSCNGGMQSRQRHCNNPKPSFGGNFCDGIASDVRMCYQQHCPRTKAAFLAEYATRLSNGSVRFSYLPLNEGSLYDSSSGMFTCHIPGVYSFTANIIESGDGNNYIDCRIRKNGSIHIYMFSRQGKIDGKFATEGYGTATGAATLHLVRGDQVDVYCYGDTGTHLSYSSFSGFLITADP